MLALHACLPASRDRTAPHPHLRERQVQAAQRCGAAVGRRRSQQHASQRRGQPAIAELGAVCQAEGLKEGAVLRDHLHSSRGVPRDGRDRVGQTASKLWALQHARN